MVWIPEVEDDWSLVVRKINFVLVAYLASASGRIFGTKRKINKNNIVLTQRR